MLKNIFIALALLLTTVSCNQSQLGQKSSSKKGKPSYLFVIMSNNGVIQQTSDGSYQLILNHGDVEKVLAFSDRPYRLVRHETGEALKTMWSEGPNSFADDPPNATVVINQHVQTVILTSITVQGDQTIFTIESDGQNSLVAMSGACEVFLDALANTYGCVPGTCTWY